MLKTIKQRLGRDDEQGFTLIELMVVVLIIAILLAIAIPTFLGARNNANSNAAKADIRNAVTAEQAHWTNAQAFGDATTMQGEEPNLSWQATKSTTPNQTAAAPGTFTVATPPAVTPTVAGQTNAAVEIQAQGKDNKCYTALVSNDPANSFTAYNVAAGACAAAPAVPTNAPAVTAGSASANVGNAFYTTW